MNGPESEHELIMSVEEYLASEAVSPVKREFVDGQVYVMTGTTNRHNKIVGNFYRQLHQHLKNGPCTVFFESTQAHVKEAHSFYYPDVVVGCGKQDDDSLFVVNPVLIIEVLSASTYNIDRREKRVAYRLLDTLKEYVIAHQKRQQIEVYQKDSEGTWSLRIFGSEDTFLLGSMPTPLSVPVSSIYDDTEAPPVINGNFVREEEEEYIPSEAERVAWMEW